MKNIAVKIIVVFVGFTLMMAIDRIIFIMLYGSLSGASAGELWGGAMFHGLPMDMAVAGYLTLIPALLAIAGIWTGAPWVRRAEKCWYLIAGLLLAAIFTADLALYGYWDFRLDMTPLFYLFTSPSAAFASAPWWMAAAGPAATVGWGLGIAKLLDITAGRIPTGVTRSKRIGTTIGASLLVIALIIPIRGGVTVSTMNMSRAYFSTNTRLNHVAVNPAFSLLYSATHQGGFDRQFRFFESDNAARATLPPASGTPDADADTVTLSVPRPDIYLIILESFSAHLMPSLGGEPIALKLDSIASEGVVWTRFYANSFRTDRALPAILSGFPSQPTTSIMKYVEKAERLPGIAAELKRQGGYATAYYYGGDANFTNMQAYVRSTGFDSLVSDKDFPLSDRLSKWGAHDHIVFRRALADMTHGAPGPRFTVVQTSSSHEPFDVPYSNPRFADNERANAFAYADSCLADFVRAVNALPRKSLIVIIPDHYAAWPLRPTLTDPASRHHVPLILTGNALVSRGRRLDTVGSQPDIAPTLLSLLGLDATAFPFGNNLLDPRSPHFAWIAEPELVGVITSEGEGFVSVADGSTQPESLDANAAAAKGYLQILYSALGK